MKRIHAYFYLSVLLVNFVCCVSYTEDSPGECLYRAMDDMYKREHEKLLILVDQLNSQTFSKKELGEALVRAAHYSNLTVVNKLISAGADIDYVGECGDTALIQAAAHGKVDIVHELIKKGANIHHANEFDNTALLEASNIAVVQELINAGANINYAGNFGDTVLLKAIKNGKVALVRELLKIPGINVDADALECAEDEGGKMFKLFQRFRK